jgi:hypothetical protein
VRAAAVLGVAAGAAGQAAAAAAGTVGVQRADPGRGQRGEHARMGGDGFRDAGAAGQPGPDDLPGVALVHLRAGGAGVLAAVAARDAQHPAGLVRGVEDSLSAGMSRSPFMRAGSVREIAAAMEGAHRCRRHRAGARAGCAAGQLASDRADLTAGVIRLPPPSTGISRRPRQNGAGETLRLTWPRPATCWGVTSPGERPAALQSSTSRHPSSPLPAWHARLRHLSLAAGSHSGVTRPRGDEVPLVQRRGPASGFSG